MDDLNSSAGRMVLRGVQLLLLVVFVFGVCSPVVAVDCKAVRKAMKQERDLRKKRELVASAVLKCPDDPILNYKYGLSQERFRKYEKALSYYQKAVRLNPKMAKAYSGIGDVYVQLGLLNEAIDAYSLAVKNMPDSERFNRRLECLLIKRKALNGELLTAGEFIEVMYHRGKIVSSMSLLLKGPALQYSMAFVKETDVLLPTGVRQLAAIGQGIQNDALKEMRFEISTHVGGDGSAEQAMEDSKARAKMIKDRLVTHFQIDPKRLDISWYGNSQPLELQGTGRLIDAHSRVEFRRIPQ